MCDPDPPQRLRFPCKPIGCHLYFYSQSSGPLGHSSLLGCLLDVIPVFWRPLQLWPQVLPHRHYPEKSLSVSSSSGNSCSDPDPGYSPFTFALLGASLQLLLSLLLVLLLLASNATSHGGHIHSRHTEVYQVGTIWKVSSETQVVSAPT